MNEVKKAIATYGLSNTGGISIYAINEREDTVSYQVVTDHVIDDQTAQITFIEIDADNAKVGFYHGSMFIPLDECIRVN